MNLQITEEDRVYHIQEAFHEHYPFLKLEFFMQPHESGAGCPPSQRITPDTPIEKIRMMHTFGWIDISPQRTAAQVEYDFRHLHGMSVQVYWWNGGEWRETTLAADDRTLSWLNQEGRNAAVTTTHFPSNIA